MSELADLIVNRLEESKAKRVRTAVDEEDLIKKVVDRLEQSDGRRLALPFNIDGSKSICYINGTARLADAHVAICNEWNVVNRAQMTSFPQGDLLELRPDEIVEVTLDTGVTAPYALTERDELNVVLENIDVFQDQRYARVQITKRKLTLYAPEELLTKRVDLDSIDMSKLKSQRFSVGTHGWFSQFDICDRPSSLFSLDPRFSYAIQSLVAWNSQTKSWSPVEYSPPALFALADPRNDHLMVFPIMSTILKPDWTQFFDRVEVPDENKIIVFACLKNAEMISWLKSCFPEWHPLYATPIMLESKFLLRRLTNIKCRGSQPTGVKLLVSWIEDEYEQLLQPIKAMIAEGRISVDALWYHFNDGRRVAYVLPEGGCALGTISTTQDGRSFDIYVEVTKCNGREFYSTTEIIKIPGFAGVVPLEDLPVRHATAEDEQAGLDRFNRFEPFALGSKHMECNGYVSMVGVRVDKSGSQKLEETVFQLNGRVVCDAQLYVQSGHTGMEIISSPQPIRHLSDQHKASFSPYMPCFSLDQKSWVRVHVSQLQPVDYATEAFDRLVMPKKRKDMVYALVQNWENGKKFSDLVRGKNRGCVLLLHGPPGTGKTLTAEAVAELRKCPLYSVSVGELGITPNEVEKSLTRAMQIAARWKAVLLLDEADIFMGQRTDDNIQRNALVGNFLKTLEYYNGIMFLTTNLVKQFDEAILSRMLLTFEYQPLGEADRAAVWRNLLISCRVDIKEFEPAIAELAKDEINGRDINRLISLGKMLACSAGVDLEPKHLLDAMAASRSDTIKRKHPDYAHPVPRHGDFV